MDPPGCRNSTGVVTEVLQRHAILVPLDGEPQLTTHEIGVDGGLRKGDSVKFDEVTQGARRKT